MRTDDTPIPFTGTKDNTSAHTAAPVSEAGNLTDADIAKAKKRLRKKYGALRAAISPKEKEALDLALSREVVSLAEFRNAEAVFLYASYASEPDTSRVAGEALRRGKILAYPRTDPASHRIAFYRVADTKDLVPGFHGIPEPPADAKEITPDEKTFCLVPALSYDKNGFRLGYGGGYYDRFLSECARRAADAGTPRLFPMTVGAVYSRLISEIPLPHGRYDLPVSLILSEKGALTAHD